MEHAYGTAIDVSAVRLRENSAALAEVTAHEFFHLWNVKRIRPQSLEPIDYQHEQDTRALWFSEGVTSTVADMLLVRAGLNTEQQYLAHVGRAITELQQRPAHTWQSVEDSSLEAWLEDIAFYRAPERSISYYNKGEILGILLDLRIRDLTSGRKSLRDLFQQMNERYAKQHRFFDDSAGVLEAAQQVAATGSHDQVPARELTEFFREYVAGVKEIPYDDFFQFVGLHAVMKSAEVAALGFTTTANIGAQAEVITVEPGSDAQQQGLAKRDRVLELDGKPARGALEDEIAQKHPGDTISVTISNRAGQRKVKLRLGARTERWYELQDLPTVSPAQLAHRTAWMHGDDEDAP
jgi:predicted metalloprotease with PDZ domain